MKYTLLPETDIKVSKICLGTMTWGKQNTEQEGHEQMNFALDKGVNFFDTAELYPVPAEAETYGETERIIGTWFKKTGQRQNIILASKIAGPGAYTKHIRTTGFKKEAIQEAVHLSLKRLQTDYIDLYQLHWPNRGSYHFRQYWNYDPTSQESSVERENIELVVKELYDLKKEGKIRYIGLSNETAWGTVQFANEAKKYNDFSIASIQNEYSLLCRIFDTDLAETCFHENVKLLAYSPLVGGMITGKYLNSQVPENSRLSRVPDMFGRVTPNSTRAIKEYIELSKSFELDPVHLALSFCRSRPFMGSVIFGASNVDQLKLILKGKDIYLKDDVLAEVNKLYKKIPMPM